MYVTWLVPVVAGWLLRILFSWELEFGEWEKQAGGEAEGCPRSPVGASRRGCRLVPGLRGALDPPFCPPGSSLTPFRKVSACCMLAGARFCCLQ